ncbi:nucleic acid/nucleotide deaminase domain-containing protein [Allostreptomyces psammosilenae]|uniref:SUKH-4 immunity protein of toxin-antitoxin system n=1 Tax=Allostreptomyces psammosilenae TaxID=1892865 RepID=A0A852ZZ13_9ACTN|nr:nucleic acid/nucleotide deaminase domain-containing protein [Allostreptomyces psammosilenae]NYI07305.1 hypothetical protein [Allostreptomyces psammosilenae]
MSLSSTNGASGGGDAPGLRWPAADLEAAGLPEPAVEQLARFNLPARVGSYHRAMDTPEPLGSYVRRVGIDFPADEIHGLWRLGGDSGSEICVTADGEVWSVFCEFPGEPRLVNSSADAWVRSLWALDEACRRLTADPSGPVAPGPGATEPGAPEPAGEVERLGRVLREIDPDAFEDEEGWWPLVVEDLGHLTAVRPAGAFAYTDAEGREARITGYAVPGAGHPERRIWAELARLGVRPEQVREVYTELAPCTLPGGYCLEWLQSSFPAAELSYSFPYGPDRAERERGVRELAAANASMTAPGQDGR